MVSDPGLENNKKRRRRGEKKKDFKPEKNFEQQSIGQTMLMFLTSKQHVHWPCGEAQCVSHASDPM